MFKRSRRAANKVAEKTTSYGKRVINYEEIQETVAGIYGFTVARHALTVYGHCARPACEHRPAAGGDDPAVRFSGAGVEQHRAAVLRGVEDAPDGRICRARGT